MYINVAYTWFEIHEVVGFEDLSVPLKINSCGYFRVHTTPIVETIRPKGRDDYQLLYIAKGKARFVFNGVETIVPEGNLVLYRPGEPQEYYYHAAEKPEIYWAHFTGSKASHYLKHYGILNNKNVFYTGISTDYPWMFNQMIQELQLMRANHEELLVMLWRHILIVANRHLKERQHANDDMIDEVEQAVHYFQENFNKDISIEKYAADHLLTANWFIKCFKNITKTTPKQYILNLRITTAKGYLEGTKKNINEIAAEVGYENPLYFSRVFKKHTGQSPLEYRKTCSQFRQSI